MQSSFVSRRFLLQHLWLPLPCFVACALLLELTNTDLWLADWLYALSGPGWDLRDAWATRTLVHEGGRLLVGLMILALLGAIAASHASARLARWRRGLWYLLVSALLSALAVNVLKELTHVACPWDLLRYGGDLPYLRTFAPRPPALRDAACFPAGHASAAYAWLGAYYVAYEYAPRWKGRVLGAVLGLGLLFGFSQQLRGAHFLSHDLWTLGICWGVVTALYLVFGGFRSEGRQRNQSFGSAASAPSSSRNSVTSSVAR